MLARPRSNQRGVAALELALAAPVFFLLLFLLLEFARALFLFMTLQDVTRQTARGVSVTNFNDTAAITELCKKALFAAGGGALPLSGGIDDSYLRIEYLSLSAANVTAAVSPMPSSPEINISTCAATPNAPGCIRFIRVQICQPATNPCQAVPYRPMIALLAPIFSSLTLPRAITMSPAESFGAHPP